MFDIITAVLLIFILIISSSGWGKLVVLIITADKDIPPIIYPVTGIAVFMSAGGWLNLSGSVSMVSISILIFSGLVFFVIFRIWKDLRSFTDGPFIAKRKVPGYSLMFLLALPVFILPFIGYPLKFHPYDDYQSYLVLPAKMLQSGTLGYNPLMDRQLENSPGGDIFLQAIIQAFSDIRYSYIIDISAGLILVAGLIIFLSGRAMKGYKFLPLLFLLLAFPPKVNSTFILLPAAFILGLIIILNGARPEKPGATVHFVLAGLLAATLVMTKTLYSAFAGLMVIIYILLEIIRTRNYLFWLKGTLILGGVFILLLLPWMLYSLKTFKTLFFPFLGRGYHISARIEDFSYVKYNMNFFISVLIIILLKSSGLLVSGYLLIKNRIRNNYLTSNIQYTILLTALVSMAVVVFIAGGDYFHRYTYPFLLPCSVILLMVVLEYARENKKRGAMVLTFTILLLSTSLSEKFNFHFRDVQHFFALNPVKFISMLTKEIDPSISMLNEPLENTGTSKYEKLISSAPPDANIVVYLRHPYTLDLSSDRLAIMDSPYAMQPFGRMPENSPDSLVSYFSNGGMDFLAASLVDGFSIQKADQAIQQFRSRDNYRWNSMMIMYEALFRKYILMMAETGKVIYDDGENILIDLSISTLNNQRQANQEISAFYLSPAL